MVAPLRSLRVQLQGWGAASVLLPPGRWQEQLTGATYDGGDVLLAELLGAFPVALLVAEAGADR